MGSVHTKLFTLSRCTLAQRGLNANKAFNSCSLDGNEAALLAGTKKHGGPESNQVLSRCTPVDITAVTGSGNRGIDRTDATNNFQGETTNGRTSQPTLCSE